MKKYKMGQQNENRKKIKGMKVTDGTVWQFSVTVNLYYRQTYF